MTTLLPRWMMGDPSKVAERLEEMELRPTKRELAERRLKRLFEEDEMGRKLEIPGRVTAALFQWGEWADRKQFWVNLRITPFCKLLGIGTSRPVPEIRLDPQSHRVHRAFHRLQCEKTKAVLYAYYVARTVWSEHQSLFIKAGISEPTFHRLLKSGSVQIYNAAGLEKLDEGIPR